MQFNCVKNCTKNWTECSLHSTGFPSVLSVFFVSSVCLLVRVTVVDKTRLSFAVCGIPWVNCAVIYVKEEWKGPFSSLRYCLSKLRSLLSFPSGMTSHSKVAQFNWECIGHTLQGYTNTSGISVADSKNKSYNTFLATVCSPFFNLWHCRGHFRTRISTNTKNC